MMTKRGTFDAQGNPQGFEFDSPDDKIEFDANGVRVNGVEDKELTKERAGALTQAAEEGAIEARRRYEESAPN